MDNSFILQGKISATKNISENVVLQSVNADCLPSKRLIVGLINIPNTLEYVYSTHEITNNSYSCVIKFLQNNPQVTNFYFIDRHNIKELEYFVINELNKNHKVIMTYPVSQ